MKEIKIQDLVPGLVNGIDIQMPGEAITYRETYFEWTGSTLLAEFNKKDIGGGILKAWHNVPVFHEAETHIDAEMFYFVSGTALMMFIDYKDGQPDIETAQIVRIQPGTQLVIPAEKGHFVAVAEGDEPMYAIVVAPRMDAPRAALSMPLKGI